MMNSGEQWVNAEAKYFGLKVNDGQQVDVETLHFGLCVDEGQCWCDVEAEYYCLRDGRWVDAEAKYYGLWVNKPGYKKNKEVVGLTLNI